METQRILIVEDNPVDALYLKDALMGENCCKFESLHVETLAEAKEFLGNRDFDIVVLDLGLPDSQGLETLTDIKEFAPDIPVIVLSGLDDESAAIKAVRQGAQDYLLKGQWDGQILSRAITYAIERHRVLRKVLGTSRKSKGKAELLEQFRKLHDSALLPPVDMPHEESALIPEMANLSRDEMGRLIHELRVHQIELEMQNENLRQMQAELEAAQANYSELYEFAPVGYLTLDRDGIIRRINMTGARILSEEPRHYLVNRHFSQFVHRSDLPTFLTHLRGVFQDGERQTCEIRLNKTDTEIFVRLESAPAKNLDGEITECRTILVDFTERKRWEQALEYNEQQLRAIFEGADDCIFLKDKSLRFTRVNPAFEKLAGMRAPNIIGKIHKDVFGTEIADHMRDTELRVLSGETIEDEYGMTIRGVPMRFLATRVPLRKVSGEKVGLLTILHDITDRKRDMESPLPTGGNYPSNTMRAVLNQVMKIAKRASMILLTGESGSGKDHLARYIHNHSDSANGPYFSINCAAIPPELAESELFGHEKGAFTGAVGKKRGLLELAEGGTLLLNEIGDLSPHLQAKLLTFLDTKKFTRVGGEKEITVKARLIAATNRDLEKAVEEGNFRKDLFYRLNVVSIPVPPLRDRLEDIPILVQEILAKIQAEMQIHDMPIISRAAIDAMKRYGWPGNVRELRNVLERALILSHGKEISAAALGLRQSEELLAKSKSELKYFSASFPNEKSLNEVTRELKRFMVNEALRKSGGNRQDAAKVLGISRYSLKHYMTKLGYGDEE